MSGGVVAGDIVRRLVARTMSQQLMEAVQAATAPFQYAMSTKSGCECIAHALQGLTEMDPRATSNVVRIARCSRRKFSIAFCVHVPWIRFQLFVGRCAWTRPHDCARRGRRTGRRHDASPVLSRPAQGVGSGAVSNGAGGGVLLAFLDDVHTVSPPGRVSTVHSVLDEALWSEAGIRIHQGKTQIWNQPGEKPEGCEELERVAVAADPTAVVWRGSDELPSHKRGMKVLGTPLGHADFIRDHLEKTAA